MNRTRYDEEFDLARIVVRPLYFGMVANVFVPMVLLLLCYYVNNKYYLENRIGDFANSLFYLFGVLALGQAAVALWWRHSRFRKPMIRRAETFEADFSDGLLQRSRPVFVLIASISLWGYIYFFFTGRFREAVFFVVFSFLVFQVVRPRYGYVRRLIGYQKELVKRRELPGD